MRNYIIKPDGSIQRTVNALVYVRNIVGSNKPVKKRVWCERIIIQACPDSAMVVYCLSDKRVVFSEWADYSVAVEYFTKRSRTFRGTEIQER